MRIPELIAELTEALKARNRCQDELDLAVGQVARLKADARERRQKLAAAERALREIEHELLTGESPLPLVAAGQRRNGTLGGLDGLIDYAIASAERTPAAALTADDVIAESRRPWTDDELDRLLVHACRHYTSMMNGFWDSIGKDDPTDGEILFFVQKSWPHSRVFVGADRTKQKHGYTVQGHPSPLFWVGPFRGAGHQATLHGPELIAAIRRVMGLEAPAAPVSKTGMDLVTSQPGSNPAANGSPILAKPEPPPKKQGRRSSKAAALNARKEATREYEAEKARKRKEATGAPTA